MINKKATMAIGYLLAGSLIISGIHGIGTNYADSWSLKLGSLYLPSQNHMNFLAVWVLFGLIAAALFFKGFFLLFNLPFMKNIITQFEDVEDRTWIIGGMLAALLIPLGIRFFILHGAALVDDEARYRFSAELLASGRLFSQSHPLKIFFDSNFIINNGKMFSQYPLGWPALMVPEILFLPHGTINSIYNALIIPALFWSLKEIANSSTARIGIILFIISPFASVLAATSMSHTSCIMALAWMLFFSLKGKKENAHWLNYVFTSVFFSLAFFIRPVSAIGIGLPLLIFTIHGALLKNKRKNLIINTIAFTIPAIIFAAAFLLINKLQNDSLWKVSYQAYLDYVKENHYRFTTISFNPDRKVANFRFDNFSKSFAGTLIALFRFNFASLGWPVSLFFLAFSKFTKKTAILWGMFFFFLLSNFFIQDSGVDPFGPVHYSELLLPFIFLSAIGAMNLQSIGADSLLKKDNLSYKFLTPLFASLIFISIAVYLPVKTNALINLETASNKPFKTLSENNITNSVIFYVWPFVPRCEQNKTNGWTFWSPVNDPDLNNDIIWANHINVEKDKELMNYFPKRKSFVMAYDKNCVIRLIPLNILPSTFLPVDINKK